MSNHRVPQSLEFKCDMKTSNGHFVSLEGNQLQHDIIHLDLSTPTDDNSGDTHQQFGSITIELNDDNIEICTWAEGVTVHPLTVTKIGKDEFDQFDPHKVDK